MVAGEATKTDGLTSGEWEAVRLVNGLYSELQTLRLVNASLRSERDEAQRDLDVLEDKYDRLKQDMRAAGFAFDER